MSTVCLWLRFPGEMSFAAVREAVLARAEEDARTIYGAASWAGCRDVELYHGEGETVESTAAMLAAEGRPLGPALARLSRGGREWVDGGLAAFADARREIFRRRDVIDLNDARDAAFERIEEMAENLLAEAARRRATGAAARHDRKHGRGDEFRCTHCRLRGAGDALDSFVAPSDDPAELAALFLTTTSLSDVCMAGLPRCPRCREALAPPSVVDAARAKASELDLLRTRVISAEGELAALESRLARRALESFSRPIMTWVVAYLAPG